MRLRCDPSAPRLARQAVQDLDVLASVREDAVLVSSELASNAVLHSGSSADAEIELCAELLADGVRIAVLEPDPGPRRPAVLSLNGGLNAGLGLQVLDAIGRAWGADRHDGLRVWVELGM